MSIDFTKKDETANNSSSVSLNKEVADNNNLGNDATATPQPDLFSEDRKFEKIDNAREQLDNASAQINDQLNDQLNGINDQINNTFDNASNTFNNFVDGISNKATNGYNNFSQKMSSGPKEVTPDKLKVEPVLACILSVIVTGLGQMINGQLEKGLIILIGGFVGTFVLGIITCGIGYLIGPVIVALAAIDAYKCATLLQNGVALSKYEFHILD